MALLPGSRYSVSTMTSGIVSCERRRDGWRASAVTDVPREDVHESGELEGEQGDNSIPMETGGLRKGVREILSS